LSRQKLLGKKLRRRWMPIRRLKSRSKRLKRPPLKTRLMKL